MQDGGFQGGLHISSAYDFRVLNLVSRPFSLAVCKNQRSGGPHFSIKAGAVTGMVRLRITGRGEKLERTTNSAQWRALDPVE